MKLKSLLFKTPPSDKLFEIHFDRQSEIDSHNSNCDKTKVSSTAESFLLLITVPPTISVEHFPFQLKIKFAHDHHLKTNVNKVKGKNLHLTSKLHLLNRNRLDPIRRLHSSISHIWIMGSLYFQLMGISSYSNPFCFNILLIG